MSHIYTERAPVSAAAMPRMPLPHPTSMTLLPAASAISRHILVVACSPVPNAMPGSSRMTFSPLRGEYFIHVGTTVTAFVTIGL